MRNNFCLVLQNHVTLMSDLAPSDWFPWISSLNNGCKAGSTLTFLVISLSFLQFCPLIHYFLGLQIPLSSGFCVLHALREKCPFASSVILILYFYLNFWYCLALFLLYDKLAANFLITSLEFKFYSLVISVRLMMSTLPNLHRSTIQLFSSSDIWRS